MCIAFFTVTQPGFKLILASNRDEYLARPTAPAQWHNFSSPNSNPEFSNSGNGNEEQGWILSGIDKGPTNGGTWLGITRDLRIGILTNVRLTPPTPPLEPSPNPPSRGLLLKEFLLSTSPATCTSTSTPTDSSTPSPLSVHDYLSSHLSQVGEYEGFNLLLFSLKKSIRALPEIGYLTNRPIPSLIDLNLNPGLNEDDDDNDNEKDVKDNLECECLGISNSPMNEPWPKVIQGRNRMKENIKEWKERNEDDKRLVERMFNVLSQSIPINKESDSFSSTQIPLITIPSRETENFHNPSVEVKDRKEDSDSKLEPKPKWYGTRTSTIILVKDNGETIFVERDILELDAEGNPKKGTGERWIEFQADLKD
ncbi:uncharacterized protein IL334_002941 [Kwoniella shivajii]|uniref:NRDE protein-domain-containing protein n=1 Tax=Kwoniella shivajii TaxID=564305 RepID=A0ABZ1CXU5_9TREE|nr:hypothetical protein IL334_002941 [Kwoniella shivajii]